ncbi:GPI biosynthesis protein family Pig-F-domain-containing protein [Myxozyma melibiosi]|uniref:Glycosylphosphatidylinositol anchor biosynthesis protein 11 n=1 Tax=Myxozyma melibiosi TaxID=54550 RepID=A0ABR1F630_9ASCO
MARTKAPPRRLAPTAAHASPAAVVSSSSQSTPSAFIQLAAGALILVVPVATIALSSQLAQYPVRTLAVALPYTAAVQLGAVLTTAGQPKKASKKTASRSSVSTAFLALVLAALLTPLLHIIFLLFGAPVTIAVPETFLLSAHTSLLMLFPLLCTIPLDAVSWTQAVALRGPWTASYVAAIGTVVGAWLGAVPIPLDWDREWQRWPTTVVAGAYLGNAVGKVVGGLLVSQKRKSA